jgi:ornithine carbamoyltransferase
MELFKIKNIKELQKVKIAFCGDGANNIVNSLIAVSAVLGLNLKVISPKNYLPKADTLEKSRIYVKNTGAKIEASSDIAYIKNADVVYTDIWTSMGFEKEENVRKEAFLAYQINSALMQKTAKNSIVLHCLPAKRGEEITEDMMDKYERSIFTQAENRLHIQKSILLYLLK